VQQRLLPRFVVDRQSPRRAGARIGFSPAARLPAAEGISPLAAASCGDTVPYRSHPPMAPRHSEAHQPLIFNLRIGVRPVHAFS
jgi:hypothetical protein